MNNKPQNYRGVRPATLVSVIEGDGKDVPFHTVDYVVVFDVGDGIQRQITLGKVVPLTEEEVSFFK